METVVVCEENGGDLALLGEFCQPNIIVERVLAFCVIFRISAAILLVQE